MRRVAGALLAALLLAAAAPATAGAACVQPRASLPQVESQVMCLVCGVPLSLADSPQASRERDFISSLIDRCQTSGQIKAALVAQYGPRVLALPKDSGFNAAVYIVPVLALLFGAGLAVVAVRWWSTRTQAASAPAVPAPSRADARRLEAEMARWDR
jgi:cytochrome c-type biogenesis protein CcmH/NrfF